MKNRIRLYLETRRMQMWAWEYPMKAIDIWRWVNAIGEETCKKVKVYTS